MFKLIFIFVAIVSVIAFYLFTNKIGIPTPQSSQNQTKYRIDKLIADKNLDVSNLTIDPYNHKISFLVMQDGHKTQVILSDQKDLWLQLSVLQKIDKMVKINNRLATLVDLSLTHPYATIQNN